MITYTANFETGTKTWNYKRSDFTHAWLVTDEDGTFQAGGCTTTQQAAETRARSAKKRLMGHLAEVVAVIANG